MAAPDSHQMGDCIHPASHPAMDALKGSVASDAKNTSGQAPTSQPDSPLFRRFPAELRNRIYHFVLVSEDDVEITTVHRPNEAGEYRKHLTVVPPLLQTCKQIRHETAEFFFVDNTFALTQKAMKFNAIKTLDRILTPWTRKIERFSVCFSFTFPFNGSYPRYTGGHFVIESKAGGIRIVAVYVEPSEIGRAQKPCLCNALLLASKHPHVNVWNWVRFYVAKHAKDFASLPPYVPNCWTCGGRNVALILGASLKSPSPLHQMVDRQPALPRNDDEVEYLRDLLEEKMLSEGGGSP